MQLKARSYSQCSSFACSCEFIQPARGLDRVWINAIYQERLRHQVFYSSLILRIISVVYIHSSSLIILGSFQENTTSCSCQPSPGPVCLQFMVQCWLCCTLAKSCTPEVLKGCELGGAWSALRTCKGCASCFDGGAECRHKRAPMPARVCVQVHYLLTVLQHCLYAAASSYSISALLIYLVMAFPFASTKCQNVL